MAEPIAQPEDPDFPSRLLEVSGGDRAEEVFGWLPALGAAFLLATAVFFATSGRRALSVMGAAAGLAALGVALAAYELRRRRAAAVLVRKGARIGVYRDGLLVAAHPLARITRLQLRLGNTFQYVMPPIAFTVVGVLIALGPQSRPDDVKIGLTLALGFGVAAGSLLRTRLVCHHYYVPRPAAGRAQLLLLARRDSERLFASSPRADGS